jgi:hypothetical protein
VDGLYITLNEQGAPNRRLCITGISQEQPPRKKIRVSERDPRHKDPRFADLIFARPKSSAQDQEMEETLPIQAADTTKSLVELREALIKEERMEKESMNPVTVEAVSMLNIVRHRGLVNVAHCL